MLAILGELCWLQFFKTVYLETSNVRFGSFFQNPVTYCDLLAVYKRRLERNHSKVDANNWGNCILKFAEERPSVFFGL